LCSAQAIFHSGPLEAKSVQKRRAHNLDCSS